MKSKMVAMAGLSLTLDPMVTKTKFVKAHQMNIPEKFGFSCPSGFSKEVF
jgi:hypothetical protein